MITRTIARFMLIACATAIADAAVMDFSTAQVGSFLTNSFEQNGILLTLTTGHYDIFDCDLTFAGNPRGNFGLCAGLDSVNTGPISSVRISLVSGNHFDLNSIDFPLDPVPASFDLNLLTASSGAQYLLLTDPGVTLSNPAGFSGISFFDISSTASIAGGLTFDNISMTEIPEPSTFLLTLSLVGIIFVAMDRTKETPPHTDPGAIIDAAPR